MAKGSQLYQNIEIEHGKQPVTIDENRKIAQQRIISPLSAKKKY